MDNYNCPNCEEQDTTRVTCPVCNTHFCVECQDENFRCCHICDNEVCLDCHTYHKVPGVRTCDPCFDHLCVTETNYRTITKEINKALNDATEAMNEDLDAFGLGALCGALRTLKNRFGF